MRAYVEAVESSMKAGKASMGVVEDYMEDVKACMNVVKASAEAAEPSADSTGNCSAWFYWAEASMKTHIHFHGNNFHYFQYSFHGCSDPIEASRTSVKASI